MREPAALKAFSKGSSSRRVVENYAKFCPKSIENEQILMQNGAKIGSGPHLGEAKKVPRIVWVNPFWVSFFSLKFHYLKGI